MSLGGLTERSWRVRSRSLGVKRRLISGITLVFATTCQRCVRLLHEEFYTLSDEQVRTRSLQKSRRLPLILRITSKSWESLPEDCKARANPGDMSTSRCCSWSTCASMDRRRYVFAFFTKDNALGKRVRNSMLSSAFILIPPSGPRSGCCLFTDQK